MLILKNQIDANVFTSGRFFNLEYWFLCVFSMPAIGGAWRDYYNAGVKCQLWIASDTGGGGFVLCSDLDSSYVWRTGLQ